MDNVLCLGIKLCQRTAPTLNSWKQSTSKQQSTSRQLEIQPLWLHSQQTFTRRVAFRVDQTIGDKPNLTLEAEQKLPIERGTLATQTTLALARKSATTAAVATTARRMRIVKQPRREAAMHS